MNPSEIEASLREIALGGFRFLESTGSTNDEALVWAATGAADLSLVVADTQLNGRGREGQKWFTLPEAGLAFSLVLRPTKAESEHIARFTGLGALALVDVLKNLGIDAKIKWPNDVLIRGKKTAGILVETVWMGAEVDSLVLGMGVNVSAGSLPPEESLNFPATCIEAELGISLERFDLLKDLLSRLIDLRSSLVTESFLSSWQEALAYQGEKVQIFQAQNQSFIAELLGLEQDGSLRVRIENGVIRLVNFGEVRLRPM